MGKQQFEQDAYEVVAAERVHIADYKLGHNQMAGLDVWIERGVEGTRFLSQVTVAGSPCAVRRETFTRECFILRDRRSGRYWFLDENACGFWLQNESFFGARTYTGEEALSIRSWLAQGGSRQDPAEA